MRLGRQLEDLKKQIPNQPEGWFEKLTAAGELMGGTLLLSVENARKFWGDEWVDKVLERQINRAASQNSEIKPQAIAPQEGPGTELKKLLAKIGIVPSANCSCNAKAREMNQKGAEWCEQNIETIIGWLRDEHQLQKVKLPFIEVGVKLLIKRAIRNARKL